MTSLPPGTHNTSMWEDPVGIVFIVIIALIFLGGFLKWLFFDIPLEKAFNKRVDAWRETQEKTPNSKIYFVLNTGTQKCTSEFPWEVIDYGPEHSLFYTSRDKAKEALLDGYADGFFTDASGVTYPSCNIASARIVP